MAEWLEQSLVAAYISIPLGCEFESRRARILGRRSEILVLVQRVGHHIINTLLVRSPLVTRPILSIETKAYPTVSPNLKKKKKKKI